MTLTQAIADRLLTIPRSDLPPAAIQWAKVAILDSIGCALAGADEPALRKVAALTLPGAAGGPSQVWGTRPG
jgi:2-methylcitrate dehydratase PrpD